MILDEVGDNDPAKSEALRQAVFGEVVKFSTDAFRQRGYDLDLSARWDGIVGQDGQTLVGRDELRAMANSILQFANGPAGGQQGPFTMPEIIAPDLAAKIGWATRSDSLLYVNLKGVTTSDGKRAAQIIFFVVVIALIVLAAIAEGKSGSRSGGQPAHSTAGKALPVAAPPMRGAPPSAGRGPAPRMWAAGPPRGPVPVGRGSGPVPIAGGGPRHVYGAGPRFGVGVGIDVGIIVPLDGPGYTHEGRVQHEDELFGGDQMYVSMTLVNAADGRVLWHLREDLDLDAEDPNDVQALVRRVVGSIPLRGDLVEQTKSGTKR
jgi:hypothetical protein